MRGKIIAIVAALILGLSVGTSPAIAEKSGEKASPRLFTASEVVPSESISLNSWSWGISSPSGAR